VDVLDSPNGERGPKTCDKRTQNPPLPQLPYKDMAGRKQRLVRADIIELVRETAMKAVYFAPGDLTVFTEELLQNKKFRSMLGLCSDNDALPEPNNSGHGQRVPKLSRQRREKKTKVCIGSSLRDLHITLTGEKTPERFKDSVTTASSLSRPTCYERR